MQHNHLPCCKLQVNSAKNGNGARPSQASNVLGKVLSHLCLTAGQVNFRGNLPCSENNVLQPVLHPDMFVWVNCTYRCLTSRAQDSGVGVCLVLEVPLSVGDTRLRVSEISKQYLPLSDFQGPGLWRRSMSCAGSPAICWGHQITSV